MKISLDWLSDYLDWTTDDPDEIARQLTGHTAEVDEVIKQGALLDHCCVGQVSNIRKHPDADRLNLCDVKTDQGTKQIVCGGTNLSEGMRVAFAHVGATVKWHGTDMMTLEPVKIRGEQSEGMICTAEELDLLAQFPEATGTVLVDLGPGDEGVGEDLRSFLGLTDTVLDIDNHAITQRPDLFSHIGFARECVAIGLATWKKGVEHAEVTDSGPIFSAPEFTSDDIPFKFAVKDEALMPRYLACIIDIDELGETPAWMKQRLEATGWRSINLPIDITNYVMMETGLPLHSFDSADISGTVHMRPAEKGEKITTLDGTERELSEGALILSDDDGNFDLLGIMGGLRSSTKDSTRKIYLHGASLDAPSIRRAMIAMGHRTDAGTTYEKGVPHITTEQGFYRAAQLMLELIPGARVTSHLDSVGDNGTPQPINLSVTKTNSVLGTDLDAARIIEILQRLGCTVEAVSDDELTVTAPLWRLKDLTVPCELYEEIGRIYGYNDIPVVLPESSIVPPQRDQRLNLFRDSLQEAGFIEQYPLSLLGPDLLEHAGYDPTKVVEIANPIGVELSLMQPSILPQLLDHARTYLRQSPGTLRTFHTGKVFSGPEDEHLECGLLVTAKQDTDLKTDPFLETKQATLDALGAAGYAPTVRPAQEIPGNAHPGRCADLVIDDTVIGQIFELHPRVRKNFGLEHRVCAVQINVETWLSLAAQTYVMEHLPQFPAVVYDETIELSAAATAQQLLEQAQATSELLEAVEIADLYSQSPYQGGSYNLTLRFTYRSSERTLTEEEVKPEHEAVMKAVGALV